MAPSERQTLTNEYPGSRKILPQKGSPLSGSRMASSILDLARKYAAVEASTKVLPTSQASQVPAASRDAILARLIQALDDPAFDVRAVVAAYIASDAAAEGRMSSNAPLQAEPLVELLQAVFLGSPTTSLAASKRRTAVFHCVIDALNAGTLTSRSASDCLASLLTEAERLAPADIPGLVDAALTAGCAAMGDGTAPPAVTDSPVEGLALDLLPKLLNVLPSELVLASADSTSVLAGAPARLPLFSVPPDDCFGAHCALCWLFVIVHVVLPSTARACGMVRWVMLVFARGSV